MRGRRQGEQAEDPTGPGGGRRGLVMVSDVDVLDAVLRTAAAAGCEIVRALDPTEARRSWPVAPLVLLDASSARACADSGLPRRAGVIVAVSGEPPPEAWKHAVAVGAEHVDLAAGGGTVAGGRTRAGRGGRGRRRRRARRRRGPGWRRCVRVRGGDGRHRRPDSGDRVLLVDCDPLGGGLDLVLGAEDLGGLRWPGVGTGVGRVPASAPARGTSGTPELDPRGGLAVLSCDRSAHGPSPDAVASVLDAGRRAGETVVCDLPRYPTEAAVAALEVADLTVLVVPADVRACAAAARVAAVVAEHGCLVHRARRARSRTGRHRRRTEIATALSTCRWSPRCGRSGGSRACWSAARHPVVPAARWPPPPRRCWTRCARQRGGRRDEGGRGRARTGTGRSRNAPHVDPLLVDRVRTRLAAAGGLPTPAAVAAAVRAETGGVTTDLDVLAALRVAPAGVRRGRSARRLAARPAHHGRPRGRRAAPCGWTAARGWSAPESASPTTPRCGGWPSGSPLAAGRRLDDASPYVDGWLADAGVRVHAVLAPVAVDGTCLSLRVLRPAAHDLAALRAVGTLDATGVALLRPCWPAGWRCWSPAAPARGRPRCSTPCWARWSRGERIVLVEDSEELRPAAPARRPARSRAPPNIEGAGGVPTARPGPAGPADAAGPAGRRRGARRRGVRPARGA